MRLFWIAREVPRTNSCRVALTGKAMDAAPAMRFQHSFANSE
jgi:hypothetical protein